MERLTCLLNFTSFTVVRRINSLLCSIRCWGDTEYHELGSYWRTNLLYAHYYFHLKINLFDTYNGRGPRCVYWQLAEYHWMQYTYRLPCRLGQLSPKQARTLWIPALKNLVEVSRKKVIHATKKSQRSLSRIYRNCWRLVKWVKRMQEILRNRKFICRKLNFILRSFERFFFVCEWISCKKKAVGS